ncbi:NAD-dependent epimerase/dehydratase family protein [Spiribacter salinus]|uniref:NAD-dependent epimerase/dehydratase family protein n=1 Tax=Spiribacter salinus TaxID=1335746 RepID=UPI001C988D74|nr:SDR family oxidoreductase [Spiribacter salinus]MBY5269435.1 hypothetical protein [Spiribacter salinus]
MRVLVTGGVGYVGWSVVHELVQRDGVDEIIIYDNFARRHYGLLLGERPGGAAKIRVVVDELLNSRALRKAVEGVDCVIHLAAVAPSPDIDEKPHVFDQVNHWGTAELGYAVEQVGTPRLVCLSSGAVCGHPDGVADPTTNPLPVNAYGRSKLAGERQIERLADQLELHIIRSGTVYGVNPAARFDTFVNRFLLDAALGRSLNVNGSGEQVRPVVPVDVVAAQVVDAAMGHESTTISHAVTESIAVNHVIESLKAIDVSLDVIYINQQQRLAGLTMTSAPDHTTRLAAQTPSLAERRETDLGRLALNGARGQPFIPVPPKFVFVHSYSSRADNWEPVMVGTDERTGRLRRALDLADQLGVSTVANDRHDDRNAALFAAFGVHNLKTAERTLDEVRSALALSGGEPVLFVTSPDHLPRVVRDVFRCGGYTSLFAASDVPFSMQGVEAVEVTEPGHTRLSSFDSKPSHSS